MAGAKRLTFPGPYFGDRTYDPSADRARLAEVDELAETFDLMLDGMLAGYNVTIPADVSWQDMTRMMANTLAMRAIQDIRSKQEGNGHDSH